MAVVRGLVAVSVGGLLWAVPAAAQEAAARGTVTGRVVDSTSQQPLSNATVRVEGTQLGTLTRDDGTFTVAGVPAGPQTVRVTRVGFASKAQPVTVTAG